MLRRFVLGGLAVFPMPPSTRAPRIGGLTMRRMPNLAISRIIFAVTISAPNSLTTSAQCILPHEGAVRSVDFSPNGLELATGSADRLVRIWNLSTCMTRCTLGPGDSSETYGVYTVKWSPDGLRLLAVHNSNLAT
ncbi:MAG: hypothetical protein HZB38_12320, partial [Planctomycetes bacterium]|nr:hypothetical protein [Planctomycetota bacterium]